MRTPLLATLFIIGAIAVTAGTGTTALFTDTANTIENTFTAGDVDLTVGWTVQDETGTTDQPLTDDPGAIFDETGLGTGDTGTAAIRLHAAGNPAWMWLQFNQTANQERGITAVEAAAGDTSSEAGELGDRLRFLVWHDDGDNVHQDVEQVIFNGTAHEISETQFPGGRLLDMQPYTQTVDAAEANRVYHIGMAWTVDGDVCTVETDRKLFDIGFHVQQERHNDASARGASGFFSDTEMSAGNTFTAGEADSCRQICVVVSPTEGRYTTTRDGYGGEQVTYQVERTGNGTVKFEDAAVDGVEDGLGEDGTVETDSFIIRGTGTSLPLGVVLKSGQMVGTAMVDTVGDTVTDSTGLYRITLTDVRQEAGTTEYTVEVTSEAQGGRDSPALSHVSFALCEPVETVAAEQATTPDTNSTGDDTGPSSHPDSGPSSDEDGNTRSGSENTGSNTRSSNGEDSGGGAAEGVDTAAEDADGNRTVSAADNTNTTNRTATGSSAATGNVTSGNTTAAVNVSQNGTDQAAVNTTVMGNVSIAPNSSVADDDTAAVAVNATGSMNGSSNATAIENASERDQSLVNLTTWANMTDRSVTDEAVENGSMTGNWSDQPLNSSNLSEANHTQDVTDGMNATGNLTAGSPDSEHNSTAGSLKNVSIGSNTTEQAVNRTENSSHNGTSNLTTLSVDQTMANTSLTVENGTGTAVLQLGSVPENMTAAGVVAVTPDNRTNRTAHTLLIEPNRSCDVANLSNGTCQDSPLDAFSVTTLSLNDVDLTGQVGNGSASISLKDVARTPIAVSLTAGAELRIEVGNGSDTGVLSIPDLSITVSETDTR